MTVLEQQPLTLSIPLYEDPPGVLRVGKSRVLLELVIRAFQRGQTPESIVQSYDTLSLPDVYAVVSYYLANPAPVDEYLHRCDQQAEAVRRKLEDAGMTGRVGKEELLARAARKGCFVIKLLTDENFDGDILRGLLRRMPNLDVVRVQDVGLTATPDPSILEWAAAEQRILLTHDRDTVPGYAYDRVHVGEPMPGVFLVSDRMPKGHAIDQILLVVECLSPEDCKDQVLHFPL